MLSAVLKRVTSIEKRLDKQSGSIEELRNKISGPLFSETDNISSVEDIKEILLRYQGRLKEHGFELNHIKSKMTTQEENVQKIKLDLIRLRSEKQRTQQHNFEQPHSQVPIYSRELQESSAMNNTHVETFQSPQMHFPIPNTTIDQQTTNNSGSPFTSETCAIEHSNSSRSTEAIVAERCILESEKDSATLWNNFINNKMRNSASPPVFAGIDLIMQGQQQLENSKFKQPSVGDPFKTGDKISLQRELGFYKNRVTELEAESVQKDKLLQELASKQEEYKQREKEFLNKLEWCEHKMRLLKQDKRRRGETIGKLLRSIDEMKDAGKLDLSRAQEGRGILVTTINTRGLSSEQRIQAAINITDTEKAPKYRELLRRVRTSESSAVDSGSDDNDSDATTATPRTVVGKD